MNTQTITVTKTQVTASGILVDSYGQPLENAHVYLQSKPSVGVITNSYGEFYIKNVNPLDFIVITYQGKERDVIQVNAIQDKTVIDTLDGLDNVTVTSSKKPRSILIGLIIGTAAFIAIAATNETVKPQKAKL